MGIVVVTQEGMGLYKLRVWADKQGKWADPFIRCYWCLPSVHSLAGYAFAFGLGVIKVFSWRLLIMYPLCVAGSSFLNGVLWNTVSLIMSANRHYERLLEPNDERPIDEEPKEHYLK